MGRDVFISYSSRDQTVAYAVCAALEASGITCWIAPRDVPVGGKWADAIVRGIGESRLMVLVFSAAANNSTHVEREVDLAVGQNLAVATFRIENVRPTGALLYYLSSTQWMDATAPPLSRHLPDLTTRVRTLLGTGHRSPPTGQRNRLAGRKSAVPAVVAACLLIAVAALAAWIGRGPIERLIRGTLGDSFPTTAPTTGPAIAFVRPPPPPPVPVATPWAAFTNTVGMRFVPVAAGEFRMGSPKEEFGRSDAEVLHRVRITRQFLMGATPVTQAQWSAVMATDPSQFKGADLPVETVSWDDAVAFCRRLSVKEGRRYRLPTEAEWEYACRAGSPSTFCFGDQDRLLDEYGWYAGNSESKTHEVGQKKPNAWGLYDMHGDVWQWCSDGYSPYLEGEATDPTGPETSAQPDAPRVQRGGSWRSVFRACRSASRRSSAPGVRSGLVGFRVCLDCP